MSDFLSEVQRGIEGRSMGLKSYPDNISRFLNNIQKKVYYLIGGEAKSAKTSYVDSFWVLWPYLLNPDANIKWKYYSFEIDRITKMAKFAAFFMYKDHGIVVSDQEILSKGELTLKEEYVPLVKKIYDTYLVDLFGEYDKDGKKIADGKIDFYEDAQNPTGIWKDLMSYASENGEFQYQQYDVQEVNDQGKKTGRILKKEHITGYTENDPELYTIIIIDHIALCRTERGYTLKQNLDKLSTYMKDLRNLCKFTPVLVSQFNRGISSVERMKYSGDLLSPDSSDFKDSSNTIQDATTICAIFDPGRHAHIKTYLDVKFDEDIARRNFRSFHILNNRNGESYIHSPLKFIGECGYFEKL